MRPLINIPKDPIDIFLEIIGVLALMIMIVLPVIYWSELPDLIPRHFDAQGQPDAWNRKEFIWTLPLISLVLFASLYYVTTIPHKLNYLQEITEENAFTHYKTMSRTLRVLNTMIAVTFAYIFYFTLQTARGASAGLSIWFIPIFICATLIVPVFLLQQGRSSKSKTVAR